MTWLEVSTKMQNARFKICQSRRTNLYLLSTQRSKVMTIQKLPSICMILSLDVAFYFIKLSAINKKSQQRAKKADKNEWQVEVFVADP